MSDKVKLIIEIPKEDYLNAKKINWANIRPEYVDDYEYQIAHGTPLDDVKAEIQDIYVGYRHGYEIMADVLQILDNIGKGDKE